MRSLDILGVFFSCERVKLGPESRPRVRPKAERRDVVYTKTSPKGEFEFGKGPSPKGEVLEVNIRVRIRVMVRMLIFLILLMFLRRSGHGLSLHSLRECRSRVVVLVIGKIVTGGFVS